MAFPGPHDEYDIAHPQQMWNTNLDQLKVEKPTVVKVEKVNGKLASKTAALPNGYKIIEYTP